MSHEQLFLCLIAFAGTTQVPQPSRSAVSDSEILAAVFSGPRASTSVEWKRRGKDTYLAVLRPRARENEEPEARDALAAEMHPGRCIVAALKRTEGKLEVLDTASIDCPGEVTKVWIDTAAYKIHDDEYAFAVRIESTYEGRTNESVTLFRLTDAGLALVLELGWPLHSDTVDYQLMLEVSKDRTNGFFNIIMRTTETPVIPDPLAKPPKPAIRVFKWNGNRYEPILP